VVVGAAHPWRRRREVKPADLAKEPYVAREAGSGTRAVVDEALSHHDVQLTPSLQMASLQSVKRALSAGAGFSLLSPLAVEAELNAGTLRVITLAGVDLSRELRAVRGERVNLSGAARSFWLWLEQQLVRRP
jgi:DNA-binding transcriptional LysR family regulator